VALPLAHEETAPHSTIIPRRRSPSRNLADARIRVLAGDAYGQVSPVATVSPLFDADVALPAGSEPPLLS
jgi:redox-sensitive bicupin YhaK (pirin superfamily)